MFKRGDRVEYTAKFCRSIGAYTGDIPFAKGTVVCVQELRGPVTKVTVEWDGHKSGMPVNGKNIKLISSLEID